MVWMIWAWRVGERGIWACWIEEVLVGVNIFGGDGVWKRCFGGGEDRHGLYMFECVDTEA